MVAPAAQEEPAEFDSPSASARSRSPHAVDLLSLRVDGAQGPRPFQDRPHTPLVPLAIRFGAQSHSDSGGDLTGLRPAVTHEQPL